MIKKIREYMKNGGGGTMDKIRMLMGKNLSELNTNKLKEMIESNQNFFINDFEFSVFSQNGEDGILDCLINICELNKYGQYSYPKAFIEFGVENYTESNTRFILKNKNWSGLVLDGCRENIKYIMCDSVYWKHDLTAKCAFIDKNNIRPIIEEWLILKKINNVGVLSIDIDGMDYHIWECIDFIAPAIVVIEFNALLGSMHPITVPYDENFQRTKAHYSGLYYGASIQSLINLGKSKGYIFVGTDMSATNCFFIHENLSEKVKNISLLTNQEYIAMHKIRQSRNEKGHLTYLDFTLAQNLLGNMPFLNTNSGQIVYF